MQNSIFNYEGYLFIIDCAFKISILLLMSSLLVFFLPVLSAIFGLLGYSYALLCLNKIVFLNASRKVDF